VHLFNLAGYSLLFDFFIHQSDQQLIQQLDKNQYTDAELFEVKVPLNMPYITNFSDYERVDGEMEVNGIYYNYVKRKVYNDTLYLMCLPNKNKTRLSAARNEYAATAQDAPAEQKGASLKKHPGAGEYRQPVMLFSIVAPFMVKAPHNNRPSSSIIHPYIDDQLHPPRRSSL
jgi:hypothetical protein